MLDTNAIIAKTPVVPVAELAATATTEKLSTSTKQQQSINTNYSDYIKKDVAKETAVEEKPEKMYEKLVDELNKDLSLFNTRVAFSIDEKTNKTVVKVIDNSNNNVIKQFPPEYLLKVSQKITELIGLVIDEKA